MEDKIKRLEEYISDLDDTITKGDVEKAKELQIEIIAVYEPEINSLTNGLDDYRGICFDMNRSIDYIGDAKLLKAKLYNYKLNLGSGLYRPFHGSDGTVTVTQHVNQDVNTTVVVTIDQTVLDIQELPESVLSDGEKETLSGKLVSISVEKDKLKKWEKVGNALRWIADKGVEVGIAALPYIAQAICKE